MSLSFIERQFPVSKVSKESYKERQSSQGQTITGLGKWWGRKPLFLVRAAILGCLLPATDDPIKDNEVFLKILSMDSGGLLQRKNKRIPVKELAGLVKDSRQLSAKYAGYFTEKNGKIVLVKGAPREEIENAVFLTLSYDKRIALCMRPEQLENISALAWQDINKHLGTKAHSLNELIAQLSAKRFGHNVQVGDCFCGGGSIPFEAARMGCDTYASDLNPIAGLLTWACLNLCGASEEQLKAIKEFQDTVFAAVDKEICDLGIEHNDCGDRALSYLYCVEADCPECGWRVPLLPSLVVGVRAGRVIAKLHENEGRFDITIHSDVSLADLAEAQKAGTAKDSKMFCPHCGQFTPITVLRHDSVKDDGSVEYGLRRWEKREFEPRATDIYHERLYAIRYEHTELQPNGKKKTTRYYCAPSDRDWANEKKVRDIVAANFADWQSSGLVPSMAIEAGYNTDQLIRERGWQYWHQLFNVRGLLVLAKLAESINRYADTQYKLVAAILGYNRCVDFCSKLCRFDPSTDKIAQTFYNQALNTLCNWGTRSMRMLTTQWSYLPNYLDKISDNLVIIKDARFIDVNADFWITDPPYADAVNYHELSEFFLAWDKQLLKKAFPDWYTDSKRVLAVRGDEHFSKTMIDIYSNLTRHMNDDGMQIVMFTHSDPAIWAQLALIMWKSGLTVTAAWNITTETEASGIKDGNYVKGTVLLVLRKQRGEAEAFLDELAIDIKEEVKKQIESMRSLEDKDDPNFSDPDYVLAAYAASLKVLTGYKAIGEIDLDYELNLAIHDPAKSEVVRLIERAKKIAYDFLIPLGFDHYLWKELTAAERFYIKGLEAEKHGNYQISTYQEYARGFGLSGYKKMMASQRANTARLKTPQELRMDNISEAGSFEQSTLRLVLAAIYIAIKEDGKPEMGLYHIKNSLGDYWNMRELLKNLLASLKETEHIDTMPHWREAAEMAGHLYTLIANDHI